MNSQWHERGLGSGSRHPFLRLMAVMVLMLAIISPITQTSVIQAAAQQARAYAQADRSDGAETTPTTDDSAASRHGTNTEEPTATEQSGDTASGDQGNTDDSGDNGDAGT